MADLTRLCWGKVRESRSVSARGTTWSSSLLSASWTAVSSVTLATDNDDRAVLLSDLRPGEGSCFPVSVSLPRPSLAGSCSFTLLPDEAVGWVGFWVGLLRCSWKNFRLPVSAAEVENTAKFNTSVIRNNRGSCSLLKLHARGEGERVFLHSYDCFAAIPTLHGMNLISKFNA